MSWQVLCGLLCASITNLSVAFLWACMRDELGSCSCWGTSINFKISTDHVQCSRGLLYRSFHSCYVLFCTFNPIPSKQPSACWARFGPQLPHTYTKAGTITIHQLLASLLACCRCRRLWKSMASQWWSSHSKVDARVCHTANDTNYSWAIQFWNMLPWCAMIQWSCPGDVGNVAHTDVVAREALAAWTWWRHDRSSLQACSHAYNANFPFRRATWPRWRMTGVEDGIDCPVSTQELRQATCWREAEAAVQHIFSRRCWLQTAWHILSIDLFCHVHPGWRGWCNYDKYINKSVDEKNMKKQ